MSAHEPPHVPGPAPVPLRCPRCGANVAPEQDWCLECGAPARTRLAPTPNWRAPIALVAVVVLLAGVALAFAFTALTDDDGTISAATSATTAPAQPNETTPQTSVPTAPAATATSPAASAAIPGSGG
ncbi:hypothetical protein DSM104299_04343 [Baekduia alba]|uniref:hypothetical protein n=1 Tax=Baekduia alba TaxID=2997333 RepID=UPI002340487C|nr:hypothetical protein [Baekduia alba]WCB95594.1 hypothetical protein DSM104299_04343 [Baekduia alba]